MGVINTWAVFWYASMYLNNGLSLHSKDSFVQNIGFDGQGVHCEKSDVFYVKLIKKYSIDFPSLIEENTVARRKTEDYFRSMKTSFFGVIIHKIFNISRLKKIYMNEQFNPGFLGLFINPFYFARKGLYQSVAELITSLNGKLLDIGCGTKPYKDLCEVDKYIGLEIEDEGNRNNSFADVFYNGKTIPFKDKTFDSLISNQVFEHVFNPDEFLQEANRVTKIGGVFLITAPFVWDEHEQPYDYARYSSFGLEHILNKHGFKVIKIKKSNNGLEVVFQLINAYIFKITVTKYSYFNLLVSVFLMAPINIIGLIFSKISPRNNDLYLDNIVLAEKFKDV